jgi:hypothetical protein
MRSSDSSQFFLQRHWPLISSLGVTTFIVWKIGFRWVHLLFLVPLFLMSLFHLSLAVVEASDEAIRYRGLSGWTMLRFDEITRCGFSRLGIEVGYMGLKHFVWPWGKLYFILDEPTKRDIDLITLIRQRMGH